jgi:hypothetical protein
LACNDSTLNVVNPNSGDTERVLGTPNDAEALVSSYYKRWSSGVFGSTSNIEGMADVLGMMSYSSLANNCMNTHAPWSGASNLNSIGHTCATEQVRLYSYMSEVERVASNFLAAEAAGLTLGTPARDARGKAWSEFLRGLSLGYLAMIHDSAAVVTVATAAADFGKMVDYKIVAESSYVAFERAIGYAAANAPGSDGFPLPGTWLPSPTSITAAEFIKLNKSYRARIRANVARNPAERAAANWDLIIADAQGGLTADHSIITSTTAGPGRNWRNQYETFGLWHQMPPAIIGMADTSGAYAAWIAQPIPSRGAGNVSFTMATPDLRFPQGATRAAQQTDFAITSCQAAATPCKRYFVNRPSGNDQNAGAGFGWSNYDFVRFHSWKVAGDAGSGQNGTTLQFAKAEVDMLQAEGLYRKGNYAGAAALVNLTRVKNGLPAITAFDATSPVPGGSACVPRVPQGSTTVCGNLWEAIKWEKRIETAFVAFIPWYLDSRGWGDLADATPTFWAVPYQELLARGATITSIYGVGAGAGNAPNSTSTKGTYGW